MFSPSTCAPRTAGCTPAPPPSARPAGPSAPATARSASCRPGLPPLRLGHAEAVFRVEVAAPEDVVAEGLQRQALEEVGVLGGGARCRRGRSCGSSGARKRSRHGGGSPGREHRGEKIRRTNAGGYAEKPAARAGRCRRAAPPADVKTRKGPRRAAGAPRHPLPAVRCG
jgi:hypothetical protein